MIENYLTKIVAVNALARFHKKYEFFKVLKVIKVLYFGRDLDKSL